MDFHQISKVRKLYKSILKLHRGLPHHLRTIGDTYVREEFKKHKNCSAKLEEVFLIEWANYFSTLTKQLGLKGPKTGTKLGQNLTPSVLESMSDGQIQTLYEIKSSTESDNSFDKNECKKS